MRRKRHVRRIIEHRQTKARLFGEMLRRFGVGAHRDITMSEAMTLNRAIQRCLSCGATERCAQWMEESTGSDGAEAFCPNASAFRWLAGPADRPGGWRPARHRG